MTPKEMLDELNRTIKAFQDANDERIKKVEAGLVTADSTPKIEVLNAKITELKDGVEQAAKDAARAMLSSGSVTEDVQKERKHAAKFFSMATGKRIRSDDKALNVEAYKNYRTAFEEAVRAEFNLDSLSMDFRAALSVGSDRDGGYLVPDEISSEIERRVHDTSEMRPLARVITISAPAWEAPFKSSKGVSGGWVGEKQARPATGTGSMGLQRIETHEQYAYPEVTQSMLDDGALNVEDFIVTDTEEEMVRTENLAFVSGNGVMRPKGFLGYSGTAVTTADATRAWGLLQYLFTGGAGAFPKVSGSVADDAGVLIDAIAALHPAYRPGAVWAMNRQTEAVVRKLRDADGRYLVGFGNISDGAVGFSLHGFPIHNLEDMPAVASDSFSIAFGNFRRGYLIIDRIGFRILKDVYTNKPYVGFYITKRVGGDVRNFDALKLIRFATS